MYGATESAISPLNADRKRAGISVRKSMWKLSIRQRERGWDRRIRRDRRLPALNDIFFLFPVRDGRSVAPVEIGVRVRRTSLRLDGIAGRIGDAVKVRGMSLRRAR